MSEAQQPFDAADPASVADRNRKLRLKDRERLSALGAIMEHKTTRAWLHDLLVRAHVFETSFSNNSHAMAFREGERNLGLQVLADALRADPDAYITMIKEGASERNDSRPAG